MNFEGSIVREHDCEDVSLQVNLKNVDSCMDPVELCADCMVD